MSPKRMQDEKNRKASKWRFERSAFVVCFLSVYLLGPWKTDLTSPGSRDDVVFAYYYPTYRSSSWTIHPMNDIPALGSYESDNPTIAARHITWAQQNGLDGFAVTWSGPGSVGDVRLRKGLLAADNMYGFRFLLMYNPSDSFQIAKDVRADFKNETIRNVMISDLIYLRDNFFSSQSYFTIEGLPVLGIQRSRTFDNFTPDMWKSIQRAASVSLFSIGDECDLEDEGSTPESSKHVSIKPGDTDLADNAMFDAYFSFDIYRLPLVQDHDTALKYYKRVAEPHYRKWASEVKFFPTLVPEYIGWGNKPLFGTPEDFAEQIALSRKLPLKRISESVRSMFFVASYNEWFEGSCLEPSRRTGYDYLNALKESFSV